MTTKERALMIARPGLLGAAVFAALASVACDDAAATEEAEIAEAREHGKRVAQEYIAAARARGELDEAPPEGGAEDKSAAVVVTTPAPQEATVEGDLDRDLIRRIVRAHINEVRHCYNEGLARNATLAGKVAVGFTITTEGRVADASPTESSLGDAAVERCIADAVGRWVFPRPGTGEVKVVYPFELSPG